MARIVVIDDNEAICDILSKVLKRAGHDVAVANDGLVGEQTVRAEPTDLVVTDLIMPNREGLEMIQALKAENPALKIIAMSGGGRVRNLDLLQLAKRCGADRVLEKPLDRAAFIGAVEELLAAG
ncbi:Response regulator receiver domain-containing protein [Tistlia consotensis]|uniref:Response regulator receiver domain-containing protein n=1 Tax=Tistlia consotensis USBA 355 TaxID=560819 RepID=A0A1Y6BP98_9PROT|nr:response regulator [Tistlia consotensis]SMF13097.1 Response regulator receiver domain-containing protein [Tistlia consotensis USBA 355]SNR50722.1 Response regulator receiver domain-containing protein [Tistlia consotensis]